MVKRMSGALGMTLVLMGIVACGNSDSSDGGSSADAGAVVFADAAGLPGCFSSNECPTGYECSEFGTCVPPTNIVDGGAPPPEVEYELGDPVSSQNYVYVAMTEQNSLAKIDGDSLAVTSLSVGEKPKTVAAAPNSDTAVVLDSINGTVTIIRPTQTQDEQTTFATLPHLNKVIIDPTGRYAVAWFDLNQAIIDAGGLDAVDQIGSFQDVTVVALSPGAQTAVDLTVGFRPREVEFDDAGTRAYVVTEHGISIIDLAAVVTAGPTIVPPLPIGGDPLVDAEAVEVDIVSTGSYAIVREPDKAEVRILQLSGASMGSSWLVGLPSVPSDVDLSPDGTKAYAVLRETSQLAIIDVPGDGLDPSGVELVSLGGEIVGSLILSKDGNRGALFTNAVAEERITIIELNVAGHPHVTWPLEKTIRTVKFSPLGDKVFIVHAKAPGNPDDATTFDEFVDRSYGYSLFDVTTGFAKLEITPVLPGNVAFPDTARFAYVILDGGDAEGATAEVQSIELDTGVVRRVTLGSPPQAVGILPNAGVAFVSQRHPLGRISFINVTSGAIRTITGFDLNSRIID